MTAFAVVAVLLAVAVAAAIAWPIWRSRAGGARRPVAWGAGAWIAIACVPALVAVAYVMITSPGGATATPAAARRDAVQGAGESQAAVTAELMAARLRENPEDGAGWATLGRSLAALGRFAEAAAALGEAARRLPGNASVLADRADVLAMAKGRQFAGEPDRLIQEALAADPRHAKALALAGTSAFERGDFAVAASYWRRLLAVVPAQSQTAREVEARTREAERRAAARNTAVITGTVAFAPGHARAIDPRDVVFVLARPRDGKGRPVAVATIPAPSLPATFRLDDGDSLLPGMPLSGFSEVILEARLGRGGIADTRPGDPRSSPLAVRPGERAVALELRAQPG